MFSEQDDIKVGVVFGKRLLPEPKWFIWRGRKYIIKEVTYTWCEKNGGARIYYFSVNDGANVYKLAYNTEFLKWRLIEVEDV